MGRGVEVGGEGEGLKKDVLMDRGYWFDILFVKYVLSYSVCGCVEEGRV